MTGIYVHIPFCRKACHYCNFHFSTSLSRQDDMVQAICYEIAHRKLSRYDPLISSIYFGGGTPSLLGINSLKQILEALHRRFSYDKNIEITLEANPEDLHPGYLKNLKQIGINRLSIGIQSFLQDDLIFMNRVHNVQQSHSSIQNVIDVGFKSYTIDLMFGLINRSLDDWKKNIAIAMSYRPPHISCYNLTIEEQTAFGRWKKKGQLREEKDSHQLAQYEWTVAALTSHGYHHYEISNYALDGAKAIHNANYWQGVSYIGFGPGAHSYDGRIRSWNVAHNPHYIRDVKNETIYRQSEILTDADRYNECIMLGLRTSLGIAKTTINSFPKDIQQYWKKVSKPLLQQEILLESKCNYHLDPTWWYLSDDIATRLFY